MAQPRASRTWILSAWRASCESFSYAACVTKAASCSTYVILASLLPYLIRHKKEIGRQTHFTCCTKRTAFFSGGQACAWCEEDGRTQFAMTGGDTLQSLIV